MATGQLDPILRHIRSLAGPRGAAQQSDGQLLERFVARRDEAAFEAILSRHGAMVLNVCRRVLPGVHDAEDAFQATFLVLARKAGSVRKQQSVGSWLYGVAYRIALKARAGARRRREHERQAGTMPQTSPIAEIVWRDLRPVLDEELSHLPEKYRGPVVLCDLEGKTHDQAARELGRPAGSVSRWLARGRELLRRRLVGRGIALSTGVLVSTLTAQARAAVLPRTLTAETLRAALVFGSGAPAAIAVPRAAALAEAALRNTWSGLAARAGLLLALIGLGAGLLAAPEAGGEKPPAKQPKPAPKPAERAPATRALPDFKAIKATLLRRNGGSARTEAAVAAGLKWLANHQAPDGSWPLDSFRCTCGGHGNHKNDTAGTAFALLPFLGAGYTQQPAADNPYARNVKAGLQFLMGKQDGQGGAFPGGMYAHGLASMALCEAYGLTQDAALKRSAQAAVTYLVNAQHAQGGWRYTPRTPGDTSVTGWQAQALVSARLAGLEVPDRTFRLAGKFLDGCMDKATFGYGYTGPGTGVTTSAIGLLCRQRIQGWGRGNAALVRGVERHVAAQDPGAMANCYHLFYATQVMATYGGPSWKRWNQKMQDLLVKSQDDGSTNAHQKGSWAPAGDPWGAVGGRLMVTALSLINLEVYYRPELLLAARAPRALKPAELEKYWADLAGDDFIRLRQRAWTLVRSPGLTVPFFKHKLRPAQAPVDPRKVARLIADLDNDQFAVRDRARKDLEKLGESAAPLLRRALRDKPSVEAARRIDRLLKKGEGLAISPERLRLRRVLDILEDIGTPEARQVLQTLAGGAEGAWLTEEARDTLRRLAGRSN